MARSKPASTKPEPLRASDDELLERFPHFKASPKDAVRMLAQHAQRRNLRRQEMLLGEMAPPSHVFALVRGAVRVFYSSETGEQITVKLFHAPAFFGEMECLVNTPHLESVQALVSSVVLAIPRVPFVDFLQRDPNATFRLLVDVSARLCVAAQHERSLAFRDVPSRLASLLLSYARVFGAQVEGGILLGRCITYDELANDLGVTQKSIQRALIAWAHAGWIQRGSKSLLIKNGDALARLAGELSAQLDYQLTT